MSLLERLIGSKPARDTGGGLPMSAIYGGARAAGVSTPRYSRLSTVVASSSSVLLADINPARKALSIINDGTGILYIAHGIVASTSSYTKALGQAETYVIEDDAYQGPVAGVWTSPNGAARITETV